MTIGQKAIAVFGGGSAIALAVMAGLSGDPVDCSEKAKQARIGEMAVKELQCGDAECLRDAKQVYEETVKLCP